MNIIKKHLDQIISICNSNNVKVLFAFGSVTTNKLKPESDIDLLVDIEDKDPISYSNSYFNLKFNLEQLFERQIDLLEHRALKNPYLKKQIEKTKVLIYER